jgi:acetyl esterase/lipase
MKTSEEYQSFYKELFQSPPKQAKSVQELRENIENFLAHFPPDPDLVIEPLMIEHIPAEWVLAPGATKEKVILFVHGGGFNAGSMKSHRDFVGRLSVATQKAVLSFDYRLAPEYPFPAALDDTTTVYSWLLKQRYSPSDIFALGVSCGGGLVVSLCLLLKEKNLPLPAALICLSPWVDLTLSGESIYKNAGKDTVTRDRLEKAVDMYVDEHSAKDPLISPIFGDLSNLPPIFVLVGSIETLLDDALKLAEKAREAGVETTLDIQENMIHSWPLYASKFPEGEETIALIASFLNSF